jgi:hypothetical protein
MRPAINASTAPSAYIALNIIKAIGSSENEYLRRGSHSRTAEGHGTSLSSSSRAATPWELILRGRGEGGQGGQKHW